MKKKLEKLTTERLLQLAAECGVPVQGRAHLQRREAIENIALWCKDYGFTYNDLASRFNLPK